MASVLKQKWCAQYNRLEYHRKKYFLMWTSSSVQNKNTSSHAFFLKCYNLFCTKYACIHVCMCTHRHTQRYSHTDTHRYLRSLWDNAAHPTTMQSLSIRRLPPLPCCSAAGSHTIDSCSWPGPQRAFINR